MNNTNDFRQRIIEHAIRTDVAFAGRLISSYQYNPKMGAVGMLCATPFLSLIVHESHRKLQQIASATTPEGVTFTHETAGIVTRSRHTLKLFEDSAQPEIDGYLDWFDNHVTTTHRTHFITNIKVRALRWLGNDLGIYYYDRTPVTNTHAAAFFLGIESDGLLSFTEHAKRSILSTFTEYGSYFGSWGARLDEGQSSFVTYAHDVLQQKDVKSEKYYATTYNGRHTPKLNALLCAFQALINTTAVLLPLDTNAASIQTIVKFQYLTLYQALQSLRKLTGPTAPSLSTASRDHIRKILEHPTVTTLFANDSRPLRNSLIHYDVDSRIDMTHLSLDRLLYDLPEACLSLTTQDFIAELRRFLAFVANEMDTWSSLSS